MLARQERRREVGSENPLPCLLRHVERGVIIRVVEARVIEQHVDPAELLVDAGERPFDLGFRGEVSFYGEHAD